VEKLEQKKVVENQASLTSTKSIETLSGKEQLNNDAVIHENNGEIKEVEGVEKKKSGKKKSKKKKSDSEKENISVVSCPQ
jgi:hypothetical protein